MSLASHRPIRRHVPARAPALFVVASMLAACAAGPDYRAPQGAMPASFMTVDATLQAGAPREDWWRGLADGALDSLVASALADNPRLSAARARVRASREQARIARSALGPSLAAQAKVSRDRLSRNSEMLANLPFADPRLEFTDYRAGFDASWELDLAGHARRAAESALARAQAEGESHHAAQLVLIAEVVESYVDLRMGQRRLDLSRRSLEASRETERLVELQRRAGLASELERDRARSQRFIAEARMQATDADTQVSLQRLAALVSRPPATLSTELGEAPIPALPAVVPVGLPSELLRRRPDVRRAERELAAATADVGVAKADLYPRIALVGVAGMEAIHPRDLTDSASRYWNVGPQIHLPLVESGRLRANVRAREAARDAAVGAYQAAVLQALADTESALIRYARGRQRASTLAQASATVERDVELARRRYAAGDSALTDLLEVERAACDAQDQAAQAMAGAIAAYAALSKALGGGWSDTR
ncbi:MAG: efflux transporter outer membrane subunit [Steroidobacteraceae bacterium]